MLAKYVPTMPRYPVMPINFILCPLLQSTRTKDTPDEARTVNPPPINELLLSDKYGAVDRCDVR
jgi:hypothetical protein